MARKKPTVSTRDIDQAVLEDADQGLAPGAMEEPFPEPEPEPEAAPVPADEPDEGPARPDPRSPEWSDHVLGHFLPEELDPEGHPTADGLRRVVQVLCGDIIAVRPEVVDCPREENLHRAVAVVTVAIAWGGDRGDVREFGDGSDVYPGNTDTLFARHPVASVITKAEARAYRKALGLRRVISAEEVTRVPVSESGLGKYITAAQVKALDKFGRDLGIDVAAVLAGSKATKGYKSLKEVPASAVMNLFEGLNTWLQDPSKIPDALKGYKKGWQDSQ